MSARNEEAMKGTSRIAAALVVAASSFGTIGACTANIGSGLNESQGNTPSVGTGTSDDGSTGSFDPGGGTGGAGGAGFEQCQGIDNAATKIPVTMFIQVDKSGSMNENNKWKNTKAAFIKFFQDPSAKDGLSVALRFWPDQGCDTSCNVNACSQPQVPAGPLSNPTQVQALINLFNSKSPNGLTPMSAALAGAEQWALNQQTKAEKKEKVVVILVTDGTPTACDLNVNNMAATADKAFQQKGILTFAVGLQGSQEAQMHTIAKGGHTEKGYFIGNNNAEAELLAALKKIQGSVLSCTYAMPESPDASKTIDPKLVNVDYLPGAGGKTTLTQVANETQCGPGEQNWYYDDPLHPAAIILCPKTCDKMQADQNGKVKIVLGCATKAN
jgi:hypothetical protein